MNMTEAVDRVKADILRGILGRALAAIADAERLEVYAEGDAFTIYAETDEGLTGTVRFLVGPDGVTVSVSDGDARVDGRAATAALSAGISGVSVSADGAPALV